MLTTADTTKLQNAVRKADDQRKLLEERIGKIQTQQKNSIARSELLKQIFTSLAKFGFSQEILTSQEGKSALRSVDIRLPMLYEEFTKSAKKATSNTRQDEKSTTTALGDEKAPQTPTKSPAPKLAEIFGEVGKAAKEQADEESIRKALATLKKAIPITHEDLEKARRKLEKDRPKETGDYENDFENEDDDLEAFLASKDDEREDEQPSREKAEKPKKPSATVGNTLPKQPEHPTLTPQTTEKAGTRLMSQEQLKARIAALTKTK